MQVKILEHTPNPERLVSAAAKLCYTDKPASEIMDGLTDEAVEKFLGKLMDMGHASPIEHAYFTFGIDGISRACSHQLVRHRLASYSQKSQRYVNEVNFEYVVPPEIAKVTHIKNLYIRTMEKIDSAYENIAVRLINEHFESGMDLADAEKKGYEDARFVLPNACTTSIVVTMNVRSLLHFFNQRCCNRAQWEIRAMAEMMLDECRKVAPTLFKNAGAPCVNGICPESTMGCGNPKK